ncbi:MFS monosaccharide transporter-like protein [Saccharata proteae CBS 121410]|uniref:MFS monosaccharide transporter-like protein n=1 Tax=Saccharata proteae CBS 121410 TaxID=1314787 RepID=A0A9P4LU38_9PEZI|nr:MFS monosaccharide transporter-like protein [Saccharata proteae CBS 121410]
MDEFETRSPIVFSVTLALCVCSTVFVFFRMVSRICIVRRTGWDDYFMILAWLFSFGLSFAICYGTFVGLGRHERDVPDRWTAPLKRTEYVFSVLYNPTLMATKTSILVFYFSLSKSRNFFRWGVITTMVVVNVAGLALTILNIDQCRPLSAAFKNTVPANASCTDIVTLYLSSAPVNIITDLAILFLPMPILTSMRLPKKQKVILLITFGFGVFVAVVDVVRIAYLQSAATTRLRDIQAHRNDDDGNDTRNASDFSWYASLSFMWSAIETNVGIMCACVPALKPLVSRFIPRILRDAGDTMVSITHRRATTTSMDMANAQRIPSISGLMGLERPPPARTASNANNNGSNRDSIGMMNFLTTPDMNEFPPMERSPTALTNSTRHTRAESRNFFDFVNFKRQKSMVHLTNNESYFPITMVTILFFVWGFAYGLLDVLNGQFQEIAQMSRGETVSIHCLYYAGYFVGPLTFGRFVLKRWGFKACYIVGLVIYACGTLVFWPSAVLTSYPAFLISNFIVGMGLSCLELAANPFIFLCGPSQYGEIRLCVSQGVQAVGTVVSPLLASKVLFKIDANSLIDVQWTYLGISLFTVLLAVAFWYVPLPEATDDELEDSVERADDANHAKIGQFKVVWITLGVGIFAMWCYVGFQESVSTSFGTYLKYEASYINRTNHFAYAHTAFAVARFLAAFSAIWIKPRWILLVCFIGVMVFSIVAMHATKDLSAITIIFVYFFEGPIFPLVFSQALRGLGRHTRVGSACLTAAISGGAIIPPITDAVTDGHGTSYAYCVVVAAAAFGTILPIYLSFLPQARTLADPTNSAAYVPDSRPVSPMTPGRRFSRTLFNLKNRKGKEGEAGLPTVEQKERDSWPSDSSAGQPDPSV